MDIILGITSTLILLLAGIFGLDTLFSMGKVLMNIEQYDELERKVVKHLQSVFVL